MTITITYNGTDYEATAETLGLSFDSNSAACTMSVPGTFGEARLVKHMDLTQDQLTTAFARVPSPPCTIAQLRDLLIAICEQAAWLRYDDDAPAS